MGARPSVVELIDLYGALEFSNHIRNELAELKPRDMIYVRSFSYCIAVYGVSVSDVTTGPGFSDSR